MKSRDLYLDNLKGFLIFLVVLGHFTNLNRTEPLFGGINNVIYSIHMPLFIFICGYLSKNIKSQRKNEVQHILYPYLVLQILFYVFGKFTKSQYFTFNLFIPAYQNWFLLGVFVWRLLVPYFNFFNKGLALCLLTIFSLGIGFTSYFNEFLGLYRILYFMPFFVLGYFTIDGFEIIYRWSKFKSLCGIFLVIGIALIFGFSYLNYKDLNNLLSYAYTPYYNYMGQTANFYWRLFGFLSSALLSFCVLFFIPGHKTIFSQIGCYSLAIYMMHMFLLMPVNELMKPLPSFNSVLVALFSSFIICWIFSTKRINEWLLPLTKFDHLKNISDSFFKTSTRSPQL